MKYFNLIVLLLLSLFFTDKGYCQASRNDSVASAPIHPYYTNYWVSGGIIAVSFAADVPAIQRIKNKGNITHEEFQALDYSRFTSFDSWALRFDPSKRKTYATYSDITLTGIILMPVFLLCDKPIRKDWGELLTMYLESQAITFDFYNYSFLGPSFQNKYRPAVYYNNIAETDKNAGYYRSSFYSGHMATSTAATYFMVKVYSDYHPDMTLGSKFLWYAIATVPAAAEGYFRVRALAHFPSDVMVGYGLGAICGIAMPELHKRGHKNTSLGVFSSPYGSGLSMSTKF